MTDLKIRKANSDKDVVDEVVSIHMATFQGFFLTFLGAGFLRKMYMAYVKHPYSDLLIAEDNGGVVGFLAYSEQLSDLYKFMIKKSLIPFAWYSFWAFLRRPSVFLRLVRALLKPGESAREEKYIKMASIGVSPKMKGRGVGTQLIDELKSKVDFDEFAYIELETDAVNNEAANKFYEKNSFDRIREFETHEGRKMYEYRFKR